MLQPGFFFAGTSPISATTHLLILLEPNHFLLLPPFFDFAGTSPDFCYHPLLILLEPTHFTFLLRPSFNFAGTSSLSCYRHLLILLELVQIFATTSFDFAGTSTYFFATHQSRNGVVVGVVELPWMQQGGDEKASSGSMDFFVFATS